MFNKEQAFCIVAFHALLYRLVRSGQLQTLKAKAAEEELPY